MDKNGAKMHHLSQHLGQFEALLPSGGAVFLAVLFGLLGDDLAPVAVKGFGQVIEAGGFGPKNPVEWKPQMMVLKRRQIARNRKPAFFRAQTKSIQTGQWSEPWMSGRMPAACKRGRSAAEMPK